MHTWESRQVPSWTSMTLPPLFPILETLPVSQNLRGFKSLKVLKYKEISAFYAKAGIVVFFPENSENSPPLPSSIRVPIPPIFYPYLVSLLLSHHEYVQSREPSRLPFCKCLHCVKQMNCAARQKSWLRLIRLKPPGNHRIENRRSGNSICPGTHTHDIPQRGPWQLVTKHKNLEFSFLIRCLNGLQKPMSFCSWAFLPEKGI